MTEMIQLKNTHMIVATDIKPEQVLKVGDVVEGEVLSKSEEFTSIIIDERIVKLSADIEIVEEVSEKLRLEVIKVSKDSIELKYMKPNRPLITERSLSNETKKSFEIPKAYNKELIKAVKAMDPAEAKAIDNMVKKVEQNLTVLVDTMTNKDVQRMLKDDLNPKKLSVDMMSEIVKHNKLSMKHYDLAAVEVDVAAAVEELKDFYKVDQRLEDVVVALKSNDLPVNKKNVDRLLEASDKLESVAKLADDKWVNILKIEGALTVEKLYKAAVTPVPRAMPLQMSEEELTDMVTKHLKSIGFEGTEAEVIAARKMIQQSIPITREAMTFAIDPKTSIERAKSVDLLDRMSEKIALNKPVESVEIELFKAGEKESDAVTSRDQSAKNKTFVERELKGKQLLLKLDQVTNNQVIRASYKYPSLNLEKIFTEEDQVLDLSQKSDLPQHLMRESQTMVMRHRQVEEIRLKMTSEAAVKLEASGLKIETEPLEKVVSALRAYEHEMIVGQSSAHEIHDVIKDAVATDVAEVIERYKQLKSMPENIKGDIVKQEQEQVIRMTIDQMTSLISMNKEETFVEEIPKEIKDAIEAVMPKVARNRIAEKAYEQSETEVRRDLGDRVEKTFKQIEPMLNEMGIEASKEAVRAVEILARNEMPISEESIAEVQLIQEKVDYVTQRMNPSLVLEMVKVGITPLDLDLDETIELIEQYDLKFGETETEKISRMIHVLETEGLIDASQRESLMGIYRTFETVSRSKGAATGFLLKNNLPLNMEQLFEAAKFIRKSGNIKPVIQVEVDDSFGRLTAIEKTDKSIKEQVKSAIEKMSMPSNQMVERAVEDLEALDVSVTKINLLSKMLMDMTLKSFVHTLSNEALSQLQEENSDESLKKIPLKELEEMMKLISQVEKQGLPEKEKNAVQEDAVRKDMESMTKFVKNNPEVVRQMIKNEIPMSPENISKAMAINKEPFLLLTKLREMMESVDNEAQRAAMSEKISRTSREILSGEKSIESLKDTLHEIERDLMVSNELLGNDLSQRVTDTVKTVNHTQMLQLTEDYYQIPIMVGNELSQLNLYILNDNEESNGINKDAMKVVMRFDTKNLGHVTAYMELSGNQMLLNLQSEYREDQELLGQFERQIRALVDETNFTLSGIDYKRMTTKTPIESSEALEEHSLLHQSNKGGFEITI